MKSINQIWKSAVRLGLAAAVGSLLCVPLSSLAQAPKGGERLIKLQRVDSAEALQSVEAGDIIIMSCPKCKDTFAQVVEKSYKGVTRDELKTAPVHLCSACESKLVTEGAGKTAKDVLVHTCNMCGSKDVSCCVMKKNGPPTAGMQMDEKK